MSNSLAQQISAAFSRALSAGHLAFAPTTAYKVREAALDADLTILYAPTLAKKPPRAVSITHPPIKKPNPFLPYDPHMYVADLGPEHVLLLNKFPIIAEHVLVVTKEYREQDETLDVKDFTALAPVLEAFERPFAFYNCGPESGASQPHRHLQIFPLEEPVPFESAILSHNEGKDHVPVLPFANYLALFDKAPSGPALFDAYKQLYQRASGSFRDLARNHNLLVTRQWMMLIPRRRESWNGISGNAVGFTGCMLVAHEEKLEQLRQEGVLKTLAELAFPVPSTDGAFSAVKQ